MNIFESISNWTSSLNFLSERPGGIPDSSFISDLFNWTSSFIFLDDPSGGVADSSRSFNWNQLWTFNVDSFWSLWTSFNSNVVETVSTSNELFIEFCQFANSVVGEVNKVKSLLI